MENNLGCFVLTDDEIDEIMESLGLDPDGEDVRTKAVRLALESVGNGTYNPNSHNLLYRYFDPYNIKTDSSAFVEYILLASGGNTYGISTDNPFTMDELLEIAEPLGDINSAQCGDIIIHKGTVKTGSQAYVYLGGGSSDVTRKDENEDDIYITKADHSHYVVSCNALDYRGNIYLQNAGNAYGDISYINNSEDLYILRLQ
jgi:hypothetical protein